jgi:signal transduction histidine kinase/CheY-like chemotaxis protein/HPt (histidine-containing phosphotransfer) domain-containing protein
MEEETQHEIERLKALWNYQILDTPNEIEFDIITKLVSIICDAPICLIALADAKRQWFKSSIGLNFKETLRAKSFCEYTILHDEIYQVKDASIDPLFKDHPLVKGFPLLRFYAGMPLKTPSGYNIGSLCVLDTKVRELTRQQEEALSTLAKEVIINMELKLKTREKDKASKAKDEFFSNMNHEIRTPINAIHGFTDILLKTNVNEDQRNMLNIIKSSTELLLSIVNDILDYSKIESGKLTLDLDVFNLRDCIYVIYELLKVKSKHKGIQFELLLDDKLPRYVKGDKTRLSQILTNLIGNAIKFTNKGFVKLKVDLLGQTEEEKEIKFSVVDTGIGIAEENLSTIFNRFEQGDPSTTRKFGGTGLGLSIAKCLVELQGGVLTAESTLGKGSNFNFSLKFQNPSNQEIDIINKNQFQNKLKSINKSRLKNLRVLLVEDTDINVKLVKRVLESEIENLKLDIAENGKVCIDKLRTNKYDIILMDLQMPVMNGFEATEYIRKELNIDTPIIALTANSSLREKEKCMKIRMNEYLSKPFKSEDLISTILKHVMIKKPRSVELKTNKRRDFKIKIENNISTISRECGGISREKFSLDSKQRDDKMFKGLLYHKNNYLKQHENINLVSLREYCDGDEDCQKVIIAQYLNDFPDYIRKLRQAIYEKNFPEIKNMSHKMKSSVALFGMTETRTQLEMIEKYALENDIKCITNVFSNCIMSLDESIKFLSAYNDG